MGPTRETHEGFAMNSYIVAAIALLTAGCLIGFTAPAFNGQSVIALLAVAVGGGWLYRLLGD